MFATTLFVLSLAAPPVPEKAEPVFQSGKNGNIVVIINPNLAPQQPPKPKKLVVNPSLCIALDEKGRLVSHDKPLFGEYSDNDLKSLVSSLFGENDTANLVIVVRKPEATSFATVTAVVDRMSEAVDKKKVLTLYIQSK